MNDTELDALEIDLALYDKGRQLRVIVNTPAWETVIQMLSDYRDSAKAELMSLTPGHPDVPIAHAGAAVLEDLVIKFQQDLNRALESAANPSDEIREYLSEAREHLDVQRVMEQQS